MIIPKIVQVVFGTMQLSNQFGEIIPAERIFLATMVVKQTVRKCGEVRR